MTPDWDSLRALLAVVREGGLSAGARAIGVSDHAARRRLDQLERGFGFPLFRRTVRGLTPTAAALRLARLAQVMDDRASGLGAVSDRSEGELDIVSVATGEIFGVELLMPAFSRLCRPGGGLSLTVMVRPEDADLRLERADVVVLTRRPAVETAVAVRAGQLELGLYARRDYLARVGAPRRVEDLKGMDLIAAESDEMTRLVCGWLGLDLTPADFTFKTDNMLGRRSALMNGLGVASGYVFLLEKEPDLRRVLPQVAAHLDIWVAAPGGADMRPAVRQVFDAIIAHLTAMLSAPAKVCADVE